MTNEEIVLRLEKIEHRNASVELNKSWETSNTRKLFVALFTYITIGVYFLVTQVDKPFINAIVPTLGFLLSTLSLSWVRQMWEKKQK